MIDSEQLPRLQPEADVYAARHGWSKALAQRDAARVECDRLRAELAERRATEVAHDRDNGVPVLLDGWRCPVCGGGLAPTTIRCPCTPYCLAVPMNTCTGSVSYVRQPDATTERCEEHTT